ncbi:MAG TPA: JAB domain-containing protein [Moheibacter sp.]|nr:JAB domain-containing protein [Moheibacter sp.]
MSISELYKVTEVELIYRTDSSFNERHKISNTEDAHNILRQNWDENKIELLEQAKILLLNRAMQVLGIYNLSSGGTSGTVVDAKQIFAVALKANASAIILAHNHPSGNLTPSDADKKITEKICKGGKFLDIEVLDHIIITKNQYYSFADSNNLNFIS